jgi:hypothetical protein
VGGCRKTEEREVSKLTLANCGSAQLEQIMDRGLHPTKSRHDLIFAAGALNNKKLKKELGSMELSNFYDGMLAAGHIDENPYWPRRKK